MAAALLPRKKAVSVSNPAANPTAARAPQASAAEGQDVNNAMQRAEGLVDQAGERVGHLAALALQRVQKWTHCNHEDAKVAPLPALVKAKSVQAKDTEPDSSAVFERAEGMVDRAGERVGHFAALLGQRLQTWGGRAREEAEDIWAEAQNIRGKDRI